jgi:hypothetical protein
MLTPESGEVNGGGGSRLSTWDCWTRATGGGRPDPGLGRPPHRSLGPDRDLVARSHRSTPPPAEAALGTGDAALASRAADSASAWARRAAKAREQGIATTPRPCPARPARHGRRDTDLRARDLLDNSASTPNHTPCPPLPGLGEPRKAADILRPSAAGQASIWRSSRTSTSSSPRRTTSSARRTAPAFTGAGSPLACNPRPAAPHQGLARE